ncbi:hypothetical protein AB0C02_14920 [Micromonospora sp. NPDC048999]|uniref:hypothetical protein n=1 Tax=Micromonospora sp. NPDC048999 TaxID=3155391 RepID=UPI0033D2171E
MDHGGAHAVVSSGTGQGSQQYPVAGVGAGRQGDDDDAEPGRYEVDQRRDLTTAAGLDAATVVLVEGDSDRRAVEAVARRPGRHRRWTAC